MLEWRGDEGQCCSQVVDVCRTAHAERHPLLLLASFEDVACQALAVQPEVVAVALCRLAGTGMSSECVAGTPRHIEVVFGRGVVGGGDVEHVAPLQVQGACHMGGDVDAPVGVEGDVALPGVGDELVYHRRVLHLKVTVVI